MRMVYLSPVPWRSFAQRPHQFVRWYHNRTGEPVLWIDPYPTRFPRLADLKRLQTPGASTRPIAVPDWLTTMKSGGLPIEPLPGSALLNQHFWEPVFGAVRDFSSDHSTCLAIGKPSLLALGLLSRFPHHPSMYDAMDDFPAFYEGLSRFAFARRERRVVRNVNVVWTSSTELRNRWAMLHDQVHMVRNGLDISALPTPGVLRKPDSSRKVFGYVGTMASWFDWEWVIRLAQHRPEDEFRLIGPIFQEAASPLSANIRLRPECDHPSALAAMRAFDVALIPFKINQLTASVDPIKYYEYKALSLPILSTDFGEMRYRRTEPGVFISRSPADAAVLAEQALRFECPNADNAKRFAQENTWEQRFNAAADGALYGSHTHFSATPTAFW